MSETNAPPPPAPTAAKPRSPVERAIVWGIILILLALVGVELVARSSFQAADNALTARITAAESSNTDIKRSEVNAILGREPTRTEDVASKNLRTGAKKMDVFTWFSIDPRTGFKRELYVYYGIPEDYAVLKHSPVEDDETMTNLKNDPAYQEDFEKAIKKSGADRNDTGPLESN